jgi:hypothetical protein
MRDVAHRVTNLMRAEIALLGSFGFSGGCIRDTINSLHQTDISVSSVFKVLKANGISLKDWRDGRSKLSKDHINNQLNDFFFKTQRKLEMRKRQSNVRTAKAVR